MDLTISARAKYVAVTDDEAVDAFEYLSRIEGIIPAIESAHAIAYAMKLAPTMGKDKIIVVNVSGRGDKFHAFPTERCLWCVAWNDRMCGSNGSDKVNHSLW